MGKSDTALSTWLGDEKRFADLYNGSIFHGTQMVKAENLKSEKENFKELIEDKNGILNHIERNRDIVMKWDDGIYLMILACENQERIHYAMPVRSMLYDGLSYAEQIRQLKKKPKKKLTSCSQKSDLQTEPRLIRPSFRAVRNRESLLRARFA